MEAQEIYICGFCQEVCFSQMEVLECCAIMHDMAYMCEECKSVFNTENEAEDCCSEEETEEEL